MDFEIDVCFMSRDSSTYYVGICRSRLGFPHRGGGVGGVSLSGGRYMSIVAKLRTPNIRLKEDKDVVGIPSSWLWMGGHTVSSLQLLLCLLRHDTRQGDWALVLVWMKAGRKFEERLCRKDL